jgi:hypothetical protein
MRCNTCRMISGRSNLLVQELHAVPRVRLLLADRGMVSTADQ